MQIITDYRLLTRHPYILTLFNSIYLKDLKAHLFSLNS